MSSQGPRVRPREVGTVSFPTVPPYHTCRGCARRHKWTCSNAQCVWALLLKCPAGAARLHGELPRGAA